jgi:hypothetical protein
MTGSGSTRLDSAAAEALARLSGEPENARAARASAAARRRQGGWRP